MKHLFDQTKQVARSLDAFLDAENDEERAEAASCLGCGLDEVRVTTASLFTQFLEAGILPSEWGLP